MGSEKELAPDYTRDSNGWIEFPNDIAYRKQLFPGATREHTAKANIYMVQAIIEYVSEPGQTVMDIMAGIGTILTAALIGRDVIAVDISEKFTKIMDEGLVHLEAIAPGISDHVMIINSPCQVVLPLPCDHIIFSPPYAQILKSKGTDKFTTEKTAFDMEEYYQGALNVGAVNEWLYHQLMERVYRLCYDSIVEGGTLTIILKDHIKDGKRVEISRNAKDFCWSLGFELDRWEKTPSLGSVYTRIYRTQGKLTVDEEDIIILRKPQ